MKLLFVKSKLSFPRSSGHDVHTYFMMRSLATQGCDIHLLTEQPCEPCATEGLDLAGTHDMQSISDSEIPSLTLSGLQRKFISYWGIRSKNIQTVSKLAKQLDVDAVIVVGLEVLPYLSTVSNRQRIWYAADEWMYHHFSQVIPTKPASWWNAKAGIVKGLYEYAFAKCTDSVWLVSKADARATRLIMRNVETEVIPNGVDVDFYSPQETEKSRYSCTLWGRLDFGPNIDAIDWFSSKILPQIRKALPQVTFDVFGFNATDTVYKLAAKHNFNIIPDLPDLRSEVCKREVVVMPFISGGGIKNKFLEAASMGMPIVATSKATNGIASPYHQCWLTANTTQEWVNAIVGVMEREDVRDNMGKKIRDWALKECSWEQTSRLAKTSIEKRKKYVPNSQSEP